MRIRTLEPSDIAWLASLMNELFGSSRVASRGMLHDALSLPGLILQHDSEPAGVLLYRIDRAQCEVVVLISLLCRAIGMRLVAVHRNAVEESRKLKPEIPEFNDNGIPIRDELEFESPLEGAGDRVRD